MIKIATETVISLKDASKRLPCRRAGRPTHRATLYRWSSKGLHGIKIETVQVGGTRCTSVEALQRFFARLSRQDRGEPDGIV